MKRERVGPVMSNHSKSFQKLKNIIASGASFDSVDHNQEKSENLSPQLGSNTIWPRTFQLKSSGSLLHGSLGLIGKASDRYSKVSSGEVSESNLSESGPVKIKEAN